MLKFAINESCFQDKDIEIYLAHNEGKSVVGKRITRTLKIKSSNNDCQMHAS